MTDLERLAKALAKARGFEPKHLEGNEIEAFIDDVLPILRELREPSESMIRSMDRTMVERGLVGLLGTQRAGFRAAIDHILEQE